MPQDQLPHIMVLPLQIQRHVTRMTQDVADAFYFETIRRLQERGMPVAPPETNRPRKQKSPARR